MLIKWCTITIMITMSHRSTGSGEAESCPIVSDSVPGEDGAPGPMSAVAAPDHLTADETYIRNYGFEPFLGVLRQSQDWANPRPTCLHQCHRACMFITVVRRVNVSAHA